jgi:hypothetical protein
MSQQDGNTSENQRAEIIARVYACRRMSVHGGKAVMQRTSPQYPELICGAGPLTEPLPISLAAISCFDGLS